MERAYKILGQIGFVFVVVSAVAGLIAFVLLLVGSSNNPLYNVLTSFVILSVSLVIGVWLIREVTLGGVMARKYNPPWRNVSVIVDDLSADSVLYRQGLRSGDLIMAANGSSLKSDTFPLQTWWQSQDSVKLTVLRNGQEAQVTLRKE